MKIIQAEPKHYEEILKLNEELVHFLSPMGLEKLKKMSGEMAINKVAVEGDEVVGFLMVFTDGADYDSVNYKWFEKEYEKFLYIDRVVISPRHFKKGIGREFYKEIFAFAKEKGYDKITCEVDIMPPNPTSLLFHEKMGFKEVDTQEINGGKKKVSLMAKNI